MAQTSINIRMDEELKREFNKFCDNVGLSMSAAFCVFARACVRQHKIPFALSDYSAEPAQTEPIQNEPAQTKTVQTEPVQTETVQTESESWEAELDLIDPED